jgi:hypothetical protein
MGGINEIVKRLIIWIGDTIRHLGAAGRQQTVFGRKPESRRTGLELRMQTSVGKSKLCILSNNFPCHVYLMLSD